MILMILFIFIFLNPARSIFDLVGINY